MGESKLKKDYGKDKDEAAHADFISAMKACKTAKGAPACRFGALDCFGKVYFVSWIPEISPVKQKMQYSSIRQPIKESMTGISFDIQATDNGELALEKFKDQIKAI